MSPSQNQSFFREADCCIIVYDVGDTSSFLHVKEWREYFLSRAMPESAETFPFLLVGNKADLKKREVSTEVGQLAADDRQTTFVETSAKSGTNVLEAFTDLCRRSVEPNVQMDEIEN
jgi:GTPase SAR1 family protein